MSFADRHLGPRESDVDVMLKSIGASSLEALMHAALPASIQDDVPLALLPAMDEYEALCALREIAATNSPLTSMIGRGYYGTITPAVIRRNVVENPAWYTAYTPYQPEISQGRLEALLVFQTMVEDLTGLATANASLLDEATAAAEAMALCRRACKGQHTRFLVDRDVLPQTLAVLQTRAEPLGIELIEVDTTSPDAMAGAADAFGVLLQYPGASGGLLDATSLINEVHANGGFVAVAADLLGLALLRSPGELGADIAVGSAQRFGVPMGAGGPHAAYMAVRSGLERMLPGRLVGVSVDADGRPAYRLALQTREQHIRRDKATSNICTAQVLLAVVAAMYGVYHGPDGIRAIAQRVHERARVLAAGIGDAVVNETFFDTIAVHVDGHAARVVAEALARGINLAHLDSETVGIACDERTTERDVEAVWAALGRDGLTYSEVAEREAARTDRIPAPLHRTSDYMSHPTFHSYRSETAMLRYLTRLAQSDLALDRTMIPLGSCTMKLNAAAEMEAITWPEFADLHPYAPADQLRGTEQIVGDLETWLAEITGYDAVSLQPNAGSQGEFAGLLAIRGYHRSHGEDGRDVCLIPSSAHGTNAASAVMAGMRVVVVACKDNGDVDIDDLRAKVTEHADDLAALMITYPSTHGVFEHGISEVCALVHDAGGQVYVDGANLNALVGWARPGKFGADVSHLNLHKTFCIPHGGGGPGVGPVAARSHLAPFLPTRDGRLVSAAPWGSAGVLPIPWAYVRMMGADGLRRATAVAVLSANYVANRLAEHYPVLYTGEHGFVAHECIIDLRPLTKTSGVTVDDVAKRLIDYGFHAPTMSFPVAGTLMIEPTESEDLHELDRFCDALIAIRAEIDEVAAGTWPAEDSPLRNAPHTAATVVGEWNHPYSRETAVFPNEAVRTNKYWPPVRRIDQAYGDRNLACSCPPPEAFASH